MHEFLRQLQEYYATSYDYTRLQTAMKPMLDLYSGSDYAQLQNTLREFAAYQRSPEYDAWKKQLQEIATIAESLRHSTGLTKPEKEDDQMDESPEANSNEVQTDREENGNA